MRTTRILGYSWSRISAIFTRRRRVRLQKCGTMLVVLTFVLAPTFRFKPANNKPALHTAMRSCAVTPCARRP
jgi:hypothetical protein